jgi:hypothetical protein
MRSKLTVNGAQALAIRAYEAMVFSVWRGCSYRDAPRFPVLLHSRTSRWPLEIACAGAGRPEVRLAMTSPIQGDFDRNLGPPNLWKARGKVF